MESNASAFATIDEYISMYPSDIQALLQKVRVVIKESAPEAVEKISYQMPTFALYGNNLVHFAAFKHHIGFYPGANGIAVFKDELAAYKGAKGSVQFPLDKPIPYELIGKIVQFRASENRERAAAKKAKIK